MLNKKQQNFQTDHNEIIYEADMPAGKLLRPAVVGSN